MSGFDPVGSSPVASVPAGSGVTYQVASGYSQFGGYSYTITYTFPASRTSWFGLEVLHPGDPLARATWLGAEVLHPGQSLARATWLGAEVLHPGDPLARATWIGIEVLRSIETAGGDSGNISILW